MDETKNRRLLNYFQDRHIWLLEADKNPPRLKAYPMLNTMHFADPAKHVAHAP
jgi:hypothetical protein